MSVNVRLDVMLEHMRFSLGQAIATHFGDMRTLVMERVDSALTSPAVMAAIEDEACRILEEEIRLRVRQIVSEAMRESRR